MFRFHDLFSILGYSYDTDCIYINGTGSNDYEFYIQLNRCGTLGGSDHNKKRDAKYKNSEPTVRIHFGSSNKFFYKNDVECGITFGFWC